MSQKFANNAASVLNGSISNTQLSLTVATGDAAEFPSLGVGDFFYLTLVSFNGNGVENNWEIVKVTSISGDTFTIERAQEGTTAQSWPSGTVVENRLTAGTAAAYALKSELGTAAPKNVGTAAGEIPLNSNLNKGNWDAAYSWGNHAEAGYLSNLSGQDTDNLSEGLTNLYHTTTRAVAAIKADAAWKATNWDAAYSWGNHAQVGYLTAVDWPIITSKPATATRWPAWNEVTGKPSYATRWPAWNEVTAKPATFPPESHTHLLSEITDSGTAAAIDYEEDTVELGGSFGSGESVKCVRIGSMVTITATSLLTHSSTSLAGSSGGPIPSQYRPSSNITNAYITGSDCFNVQVTNSGNFNLDYRDDTGSSANQTDSGFPPTITYNIV